MQQQGQTGAIVTLLCDSGERYLHTYHNQDWVAETIGEYSQYTQFLEQFK